MPEPPLSVSAARCIMHARNFHYARPQLPFRHHHAWAKANLERMTGSGLTCEAVLSECFYLLEKVFDGRERLSALLERGVLRVDFALPNHLLHVLQLLRRYHDTPMSLADACLVRMSE